MSQYQLEEPRREHNFEKEEFNFGRQAPNYGREEAYNNAKKRVQKLLGFYWHFAVYIIVNLALITIIGLNMDRGDHFWSFGTFATAFFWGIGLLFHFLGVFGPTFMFGRQWEQRKIQEYMERDRKNWD